MPRRNRDRRPARRAPQREAKERFLVVCEGECTEPQYIHGFIKHFRVVLVKVEVSKERGDPKKIVEIAKAESARAAKEAKQQRDSFLAFDEVWCVFDRDEHERFFDAIKMATDNGFKLAVSNPCIELWLLLHFRESPGDRHRHDLQRMLRDDFMPGYDKSLKFEALADGVSDAERRAERLRHAGRRDGRTPPQPHHGLLPAHARPASEEADPIPYTHPFRNAASPDSSVGTTSARSKSRFMRSQLGSAIRRQA